MPPRKRGRPPAADPRRHHVPACLNDAELRAFRIGQNSIRTTKTPDGLPDSVYARLLLLYGRVRPVDIQRKLRDWGYGEILTAPGFRPAHGFPAAAAPLPAEHSTPAAQAPEAPATPEETASPRNLEVGAEQASEDGQ